MNCNSGRQRSVGFVDYASVVAQRDGWEVALCHWDLRQDTTVTHRPRLCSNTCCGGPDFRGPPVDTTTAQQWNKLWQSKLQA